MSASTRKKHHPLYSGFARVRDSGIVLGAGFLASENVVCTCAHVVNEALGRPYETMESPGPDEEVELDFPFVSEEVLQARVAGWTPIGTGVREDVALLKLQQRPPEGSRPLTLLETRDLSGRGVEVYGFPRTDDVGVWVEGVLGLRRIDHTVQISEPDSSSYRIQPGFSGAPVWDKRGKGVVGMIVTAERDQAVKVAFMIPNDVLALAPNDEQGDPSGGDLGTLVLASAAVAGVYAWAASKKSKRPSVLPPTHSPGGSPPGLPPAPAQSRPQEPPASTLDAMAQLLIGQWFVRWTDPAGQPSNSWFTLTAESTFVGSVTVPTGWWAVEGQWSVAPGGALVLQGTIRGATSVGPYTFTTQFTHITQEELVGISGGGAITWTRTTY